MALFQGPGSANMLGSSPSSTGCPPAAHSRSSPGSSLLCSHSSWCDCFSSVTNFDQNPNLYKRPRSLVSNLTYKTHRMQMQRAIKSCVIISVCVCVYVLGNVLNIQSCFYFYSSASLCGECSECPHFRHPEGWFSFENEL